MSSVPAAIVNVAASRRADHNVRPAVPQPRRTSWRRSFVARGRRHWWDPTDGFLMTRDDVLAPLEAKEKLEAAG
jgi:hypothetical protein